MNKWKLLFFIVIGLNVIILILLMSLMFQPQQDLDKLNSLTLDNQQEAEFIVHSNKKTLNTYINEYIEKNTSKSPFRYQVVLEDVVNLTGSLELFNTNVEFLLTFEPEVNDDGSLILRQQRMVLGQLELPVPFVLSYIEKYYQLPSWVSIYPNEEIIHLKLTDIVIDKKYNVNLKKFDLVNDDIIFNISSSK